MIDRGLRGTIDRQSVLDFWNWSDEMAPVGKGVESLKVLVSKCLQEL